jgi:D-alanine transaminase
MLEAMSETVYLNGQFLPFEQAHVSVRDRGFLFADGVYEVVRYYNGRPVAMAAHLERLKFSLGRIQLTLPTGLLSFDQISDELVARNGLLDASVYWQVTRGAAARTHAFPSPPVPPTVVAMVQAEPPLPDGDEPKALQAITHDDLRWTQCAIKSVSLLANVLARQAAVEAGCDEAILLRGRTVTEGTARSIFIAEGGKLVTHPLDGSILGSITRQITIDLAQEFGLPVVEEQFEEERLRRADEVITVGTTTEIAAIVRVDEQAIADGHPGPVVRRLCAAYRRRVRRECGIG